jgi:DNA-binding CsgD family transcriptional regulator
MRETDSSWTLLVDFLTDAARSETIEEGFDQLLSMAERLVPADRGVSLMRMDGRIPFCVRWPDYATPLVSRFNTYLNTRSPMYYRPPYRALSAVDWNTYENSVYHNEFNRPLGIRHSVGVGFRDESAGVQYALFVHRGRGGPPFAERECQTVGGLWRPLTSVLSLLSRATSSFRSAVRERETLPGCRILSAREAQVADLICRRLTMRQIALKLGISPRTVERHALHIYQKLNLGGRDDLLRLCSEGILSDDGASTTIPSGGDQ